MEPWLTYAHFLTIFGLFALLLAEFSLLRVDPSSRALNLLARLDAGYGFVAILVLVTGALRVFFGDIPASYWGSNPVFWTKMALFVAVGLLSIAPTVTILKWKRTLAQTGTLPDAAAWRSPSRWLHAELGLFVLIPLAAVFMGR